MSKLRDNLDPEEEKILVLAVQKGDEEALSRLYKYYINPIYRYIYRQVGSREEAEDITSEVFIKVINSVNSFNFQSKFKTWLYRLAYHAIMDYWRKHYKLKTSSLDLFFNLGEEPEERSFATEDQNEEIKVKEEKISEILDDLPENYRAVLELRFLKGYSIKETAAELDISVSNAKVLQHRALKKAAEVSE